MTGRIFTYDVHDVPISALMVKAGKCTSCTSYVWGGGRGGWGIDFISIFDIPIAMQHILIQYCHLSFKYCQICK